MANIKIISATDNSRICFDILASYGYALKHQFQTYLLGNRENMTVELFSRILGNPAAPRVIVTHGLCGSGRNWLSAGEKIAAAGFCAELLDMRDHGQSPWTDQLDYPVLAEDFIAHWQKNPKPFIFLGHSMGGKLGMALAAQHIDVFGKNFRGLCVVDIAPKSYSPTYLPALEACRDLDLSAIKSRSEADSLLASAIPHPVFRQFLLSNLTRDKNDTYRWNCNYALIAKELKKTAGTNPLNPENHFDGPTLFIAGSRSDFVSPADNHLLKKYFPASELKFLPTGHNVHIEEPDDFVKTFVAWANNI